MIIQTRIILCMAARGHSNGSNEIDQWKSTVVRVNRIYFREGNKCVHPFTDELRTIFSNMAHGIFLYIYI